MSGGGGRQVCVGGGEGVRFGQRVGFFRGGRGHWVHALGAH